MSTRPLGTGCHRRSAFPRAHGLREHSADGRAVANSAGSSPARAAAAELAEPRASAPMARRRAHADPWPGPSRQPGPAKMDSEEVSEEVCFERMPISGASAPTTASALGVERVSIVTSLVVTLSPAGRPQTAGADGPFGSQNSHTVTPAAANRPGGYRIRPGMGQMSARPQLKIAEPGAKHDCQEFQTRRSGLGPLVRLRTCLRCRVGVPLALTLCSTWNRRQRATCCVRSPSLLRERCRVKPRDVQIVANLDRAR